MRFGGLEDDREDSTAPHITFRPQKGGHRQCGLAICTFHLGFSLGILLYWWQPCRQQLSKATLKVSAMPDFVTLNPAELTDEQLRRAETTFERLKEKPLDHAAEVGTDQQRASLDRAVLGDVLGLEEAFYEGVRRLAQALSAEPSIIG